MASLITLCNQALSAIAKGHIAGLSESSPEARECARQAQPLLDEMITWSQEIPLGRVQVTLAETANDRPSEWLHCYAAPADLDAVIAIRETEEVATDLPLGGPWNFPLQEAYTLRYLVSGGKIYTNVETAVLLYTKNSISADELSPQMQRAFVLELAARIATPLTKDPKTTEALVRQAELARGRALAAEENKGGRWQARYISEAEYARRGIGV